MDHLQIFLVHSWNFFTSYEKIFLYSSNSLWLVLLKAIKKPIILQFFWRSWPKKGLSFFSKTTHVDHFATFINKKFWISKNAINRSQRYQKFVVACKFWPTSIDLIKSYSLPNVCRDFGHEKCLMFMYWKVQEKVLYVWIWPTSSSNLDAFKVAFSGSIVGVIDISFWAHQDSHSLQLNTCNVKVSKAKNIISNNKVVQIVKI